MKLKLRAVGTSTGVVLPKETLHRLNVKRGDTLFAVETPDGYLLTRTTPSLRNNSDSVTKFCAITATRFVRLQNE